MSVARHRVELERLRLTGPGEEVATAVAELLEMGWRTVEWNPLKGRGGNISETRIGATLERPLQRARTAGGAHRAP